MALIEIYPIDEGLNPKTDIVRVPLIGHHDSVLYQDARGMKQVSVDIHRHLVKTGLIKQIEPREYVSAILDGAGYPNLEPPVTPRHRELLAQARKQVP